MKMVTWVAALALGMGLVGGALAADANAKDVQPDERLEALAKRLANVETLIGPHEKGTPGKPTFATRLDRLEDRADDAKADDKTADTDLRRLQQQIKDLAGDFRKLDQRVDALERATRAERTEGALRDLKNDVERLRQGLDAVQSKLR